MLNEQQQQDYMKKWFTLSEQASMHGFTWPSLLENDEWCQYMSTSIKKINKREYYDIIEATDLVKTIFQRIYEYLLKSYEGFLQLKLPTELWEVTRTHYEGLFSYFTRFDFIVNNGEIKLIEINADTPTGYLEPSVANQVLCDHHNVINPNCLEEKLHKAWNKIITDYQLKPNDLIHFTSYDWHEEDFQTVKFIQQHCPQPNDYVGIQSIVVKDDGLYTPDGIKIEYLYRLYPLEYLLDDKDSSGKRIGLMFLDHIANGRVKIINPPSAFLIQNKGVLALIWQLHEHNQWFTEQEHAIIEKYFLPTYFSKDRFEENDIDYVKKATLGREGGGVSIINQGKEVAADKTPYYDQQHKIYQKYIEMPDCTIDTWDGEYTGKLLIGSHLIGGEAAGLFLRVGEKITGNLSMFIGITTE
ncbi:glutathionylspermidine synthase family protein [Bacillus cereus group sp. Bc227]|uniref:glutathionylspermidine synthase family protein n=1 Tax=Bacillus cereus group sp. Bc227 TaxID=3018110 RepID=UPI0022E69E93|nr:glutathionylspermidine synthase family protein [Bacillus cereus group sp. Bc227]MDA2230960.1 glutathionylspermidine synthase family protein [Bacillus cereus group sp. Bc227]